MRGCGGRCRDGSCAGVGVRHGRAPLAPTPFTNHQSPITNHQSPITNHHAPITNHRSPRAITSHMQ
ncbi:hypothetical protein CR163_007730 [Prosthecochloris sp. ZM_2]|nr:hypothetical protein CR163_007730 [Prosthecochloris sp. ZM_2]